MISWCHDEQDQQANQVPDASAGRKGGSRLPLVSHSHDGIEPNSTFVVFSQSNPFQAEYNEAMHEYQVALMLDKSAQRRNAARRARHDAMVSCGLTRVRVNGKVFYE